METVANIESLLSNIDVRDIVRPLISFALGLLIGLNRELKGRAAGLRTQVLVSVGACIFSLTAIHLHEEYTHDSLDPIRVISGVVGGIGFLGAGSIIQARGEIRGVTTAATVWVSGATGVAVGLGYYVLACVTVVLALIILVGLRPISHGVRPEEDDEGQKVIS